MRSGWLGRLLSRSGEGPEERLAKAAELGDWPGVLQIARRGLRREPDSVVLLNFAARARLETLEETERDEALSEATVWLDRALELAPEDPTSLYHRGVVAYLEGDPSAAEGLWRRTLEQYPEDEAVRAALVKAWVEAGEVPEWGVPVVETALLDDSG